MKYSDLNEEQKRTLRKECMEQDGADEETAKDTANTTRDPDGILRMVFCYDDDTEIS